MEPISRERALELAEYSGLSLKQIARACGEIDRVLLNGALKGYGAQRFEEFEILLHSIPGDTPAVRRLIVLNSSQGASIFSKFSQGTRRPQRIQFSVPVKERLGIAD